MQRSLHVACPWSTAQRFRVLAALLLLLVAPGHAAGQDRPAILVLQSYQQGFAWTNKVMEGLRTGLDTARAEEASKRPTPELFVEYMDTKRFAPERIFPAMRILLQTKYGDDPPDLVITVDDNALEFMLQHGDNLLPGVPVVFCGVNFLTDERLAGHDNYTGVVEDFDLPATVELALSLHPMARHLAVVTDATPTGKYNRQRFQEYAPRLEDRVQVIKLGGLAAAKLAEDLHSLPRDTLVLYLLLYRDAQGKAFSTREGVEFVVHNAARPVYSCWDFTLGHGVIGGKMVSGKAQGEEAMRRALRILAGEAPGSVPILRKSPNRFLFDYKAMTHAGLIREDLPEGSMVLGQVMPFSERYKVELRVASALFLLLCLMVLGMGVNILQRRQAQRALARTLEEFQTIFDNTQMGILMLRGGRTIYRANQRLADIFGYGTGADMVGRGVDIFHLDQEHYERFGQQYYESLASGAMIQVEYEAQRKDGERIWIVLSGKAVDTASPPDLDKGVIWVIDDITARKKAEHELARLNRLLEDRVVERTAELESRTRALTLANMRLQELDQLKSAFLTTVSHDLRTPLTSVRGFAKLVRRDFARSFRPFIHQDPSLQKHADRITDNLAIIEYEGKRLTRLVNDVLDLSRIELGQLEWRDQPLDLGEIVAKAVNAVQGHLDRKPLVNLERDLAPELPAILADPDRILQVLVNLLDNAAKFTEQGAIRVAARPEDAAWVRIEVSDTGPGIPPDDQERIFDKFHQVEHGDTLPDTPKGSGLGLAICKEIVLHYGGVIAVRSEPGKGCTFHLTLPAHREG